MIGYANPGAPQPAKSTLPGATRPLWKPEPVVLLSHPELDLSQKQRRRIQTIGSDWTAEKAKLEQAMAGFQPKQGRTDQITSTLAGYSDLSRAYDARRSHYWSQAFETLNANQKGRFDGGTK